jgi:hypothetical protein
MAPLTMWLSSDTVLDDDHNHVRTQAVVCVYTDVYTVTTAPSLTLTKNYHYYWLFVVLFNFSLRGNEVYYVTMCSS